MGRRDLTSKGILLIFGAGVLFAASAATAQEPDEPDEPDVPVLPETVVEGRLETTPAPNMADSVGQSWFSTPFTPSPSPGYGVPDNVTGIRIAVPPLDFPGSVGAITRSAMDDQVANELSEILRDVSGVAPSVGGSANRTDDLLIRGFRVRGNSDDFRKNGFRDSSRVQRDLANVERIEILKGPASVLYGAVGEPGGLVNFITEQPLYERRDEFRAQTGFFDLYRFTLDSTGPLLGDVPLYYRLNIAVEDADSFRDFVYQERFFIAPVLRWDLGDCTQLTLEGEFLYDERMTDRGIPLYKDSLKAVPIERFLGEPTDFARFNDGQVSLRLDRQFTEDWALRAGWVSNWSDEDRDSTDTRRLGGGGSSSLLQRRRLQQDAMDENHYFIGDLTGDMCLAGMRHQVLLGTELGTTMRDDLSILGNAMSIDIFDPVYGLPQPTPNKPRFEAFDYGRYGLYLQDLITFAPRWKFLAGLRQDWIDSRSLDTQAGPDPVSESQTSLNPRFGLVWQPWTDVASLYGAYSTSFQPVVGSGRLGDPFDPESGESCEAGLKLDLLDQQLGVTLAGFRTLRSNVLVPDSINPDYSLQVGRADSTGVELDVVGNLTARWQLIANAAYIDARVTRDTDAGLEGNRLPNVPYCSSAFWTRYDLIQQCCRNLGVAAGMTYVGHRAGDAENSYRLPSYTRWDAGLYATRGPLRLSLYAENLFDAWYIVSSRNTERNLPGAPFGLRGVASWAY